MALPIVGQYQKFKKPCSLKPYLLSNLAFLLLFVFYYIILNITVLFFKTE